MSQKPIHNPNEDVVRRGINRQLPCKLTDEEFMRIARERVAKESLLAELETDLKNEVDRRKTQIKELEDEIGKKGRELHSGFQDRTVACNQVFRRLEDGTGYVIVVRLDDYTEVEREPATPAQLQRHLPDIPQGGILAKARTAQAAEEQAPAPAGGDDVPADVPAEERPAPEEVDEIAADEDARRAKAGGDPTEPPSDADVEQEGEAPKRKRSKKS